METKYNIVKNQIRSMILQGRIQPHQKIGSESELMEQFNVSRHTIRKAIGDLANDGWLYKKQGAGTFCSDRSVESDNTGASLKKIAVITTYFSDYIFPTIIRGIESYLSENGFQMTVFSTNNDIELERKYLEVVLSGDFDGLIVEPTKSALLNPNISYYLNIERLGIPYVMINAYYEELEPLHLIMDDTAGGLMATTHIIKHGHTNILGFFKNDDIQGIKRMKGFILAHRANKLQIVPQNIVTYTTETKDYLPMEALYTRLRAKGEAPTAIVCYNDQLAVMLLDVLRDMNISVPEDMSIIGYDDSFLAVATEVKLTTITHPKVALGVDAARTIHQFIAEKNDPSLKNEAMSIMYPPKLKQRRSVRELQVKEVAYSE
ncbi:GntR family transcriptional regulator [Paenalkalicoccus suaedae]|uniref:GntR family transcriptional regulator n=1 Tax=Paenalkalicoccus suaedae TaxID=2592382 RepID=A0A859FID4_9BACI|nr:GntR family transcriptional regulator [Paenalkalicoccus suaedae]QKS72829.1 GntR family transcriptional regulator [Paenalkalicoccus suaedae]